MGTIPSKINDLQFLSEVTALPAPKLLSLVEEDFDLIVDTISVNELKHAPISLELFTKLTIFRETKETSFDLEEKAYVADCISAHYPSMFHESHYTIDRQEIGEKDAQYYLVLTGMFPEFIMQKRKRNGAPDVAYYKSITKVGFQRVNREILANHIDDWVELLYYVKTYCWS